MSDRIVIMQNGRIEQVGTPSELYQHPQTTFAASFLGKSNFLLRDGTVFALRPEKIDLDPEGKGKGANKVTGTVQSVTYFGAVLKYQVEVPGLDLIEVDVDAWRGGQALTAGARVDLTWVDSAAVRLSDQSL